VRIGGDLRKVGTEMGTGVDGLGGCTGVNIGLYAISELSPPKNRANMRGVIRRNKLDGKHHGTHK